MAVFVATHFGVDVEKLEPTRVSAEPIAPADQEHCITM